MKERKKIMFTALFAVIAAASTATKFFVTGATLGTTLYVASRTKSRRNKK